MIKRMLYLTDTHLGAKEGAWGQQPTCPHLVPAILRDLADWLRINPVDLVLHGGDLTDTGTIEQQEETLRILSDFPAPVRVCLGNHDLGMPDSLSNWLGACGDFFGPGRTDSADYVVDLGSAALIVVTNCWQGGGCEPSFHWPEDSKLWSALTDGQYRWISDQLDLLRPKPVILALHAALYPLPPRLTGEQEPLQVPPGPYVGKIRSFLSDRPQVRLVLSGHCHASCRTPRNGCAYLTTAAFFEPPFQTRLITISDDAIDVSVAYPICLDRYGPAIDEKRFWTAGQWIDWRVHLPI